MGCNEGEQACFVMCFVMMLDTLSLSLEEGFVLCCGASELVTHWLDEGNLLTERVHSQYDGECGGKAFLEKLCMRLVVICLNEKDLLTRI